LFIFVRQIFPHIFGTQIKDSFRRDFEIIHSPAMQAKSIAKKMSWNERRRLKQLFRDGSLNHVRACSKYQTDKNECLQRFMRFGIKTEPR
jgi:hypothetical protein